MLQHVVRVAILLATNTPLCRSRPVKSILNTSAGKDLNRPDLGAVTPWACARGVAPNH